MKKFNLTVIILAIIVSITLVCGSIVFAKSNEELIQGRWITTNGAIKLTFDRDNGDSIVLQGSNLASMGTYQFLGPKEIVYDLGSTGGTLMLTKLTDKVLVGKFSTSDFKGDWHFVRWTQDLELYLKGKSHLKAGRIEKGITSLKKAVDLGNNDALISLAWFYAASAYLKHHDGDKAYTYAELAVRKLVKNWTAWDAYAAACARRGQPGDFKEAVRAQKYANKLLLNSPEVPKKEKSKLVYQFRIKIDGFYSKNLAYDEGIAIF